MGRSTGLEGWLAPWERGRPARRAEECRTLQRQRAGRPRSQGASHPSRSVILRMTT